MGNLCATPAPGCQLPRAEAVLYAAGPCGCSRWCIISPFYTLLDHQADFLIIDKAPGVAVQGDPHSPSVLEHVRRDLGLAQLFPVHRLDVGTSGLVVAAKTQAANSVLSQAFQAHQVTKCYIAIATKKPLKKQGWVIGDMEKSRGGSYRLCHSQQNPARTAFRSYAMTAGRRLFVLRPLTGKTHQLRVAMKALGAPIAGDQRYGGEPADRMYLHAWRLEFEFVGHRHLYRADPDFGELFKCPPVPDLLAELGAGEQWRLGL